MKESDKKKCDYDQSDISRSQAGVVKFAEVLTIRLETLPDKHAGAGNTGHLAWPGGDLVTICNTNTESDTCGSG